MTRGRRWLQSGLVPLLSLALLAVTALPATAQPVRQVVIETSAGTMVWDLLTDKAPKHVALFVKTVESKGLDGTIFHSMVARGAIQGGDPLTRDPKMRAKYGTGGLGTLPLEPSDEKMSRGAVAAVRVSGRPDTGGTQFLLCVGDQPGLQDKFTVFARVVEGMRVAEKIAETPLDARTARGFGRRRARAGARRWLRPGGGFPARSTCDLRIGRSCVRAAGPNRPPAGPDGCGRRARPCGGPAC